MKIVSSVGSFLETIKLLEEKYRDRDGLIEKPLYFYRGEEECFPTISSSLYLLKTKGKLDERVSNIECSLLEDAKTRFPEIVNECRDNIDMLIRFQHYGLPTRLLDVSSNPLVALYFACKKNKNNRRGRVLICTKHITPYNRVQLLGSLLCTQGPLNLEKLALKICGDSSNVERTIILLSILLNEPLLFRAPQTNQRIKVQDGAFVLTPLMKFITNQQDNLQNMNVCQLKKVDAIENDDGLLKEMFEPDFIIIPANVKESILDELDRIGVNESILFPDEEHKMHYIKDHYIRYNKYNWKLDSNF